MGTLVINGKRIKVDDSFAKLSPADQQKTVDEIAAQMGAAAQEAPPAETAPSINMSVSDRFAAKRAADPVTAEYNMALQQVRELYPDMTEEQFRTFSQGRAAKGNLPAGMGMLRDVIDPNVQGVAAPMNLQQITQNDQLFGFGDEIGAGASALADMTRGVDPRASYSAWERMNRARREKGIQDSGGMGQAASVVGQLTSFGPSATAAVAPSLGRTVATGAATGGAMGAVQGFGSADGDLNERLQGAGTNAAVGAAVGAAVPLVFEAGGRVVNRIANNRAVNAAVRNAPNSDDLASAASDLFKSSKSSGIGVKADTFKDFAAGLVQKAQAADIDGVLDGEALAVYQRMVRMAQDAADNPETLSLSRLHNLRQMAQDVVIEAKKNRTKNFAQAIIDGLDDLVGTMKPSQMYIPPNRIGGPTNAANDLLDGISTWSKAKKVGLIEQAIAKAQNYSSGVESGLVNQFRTLLNNKNTAKLFTDQERRALQQVVQGTLPVKALRTLGIFKGLGGALVGSSFGPWGAVAGWAAGAGGKKLTEASTLKAAQRAGMVAATPNLPNVPYVPRRLPSTPLPLLLTGN